MINLSLTPTDAALVLAALQYSGTCHAITLWPLGGFAEVSHDKGPKEDLWVSFAGPLSHIPMGLMWYGIVALVVRGPFNIMYGASTSRWPHAWVGGEKERPLPSINYLPNE